jgi:hypothetical protein
LPRSASSERKTAAGKGPCLFERALYLERVGLSAALCRVALVGVADACCDRVSRKRQRATMSSGIATRAEPV